LLFFDPANPGSFSVFHDSDGVTGINYPMQVNTRPNQGNVIATNLIQPLGIYEYDQNSGAQVGFVNTLSTAGLHTLYGIAQLGNGNYMLTNGQGIYVVDPAGTLVSTPVSGIDARYVGQYNGSPIQAFCDPAPSNSTGSPAHLSGWLGTGVGSGLHLEATGGPAGEFGYLLIGTAPETNNPLALGNGLLCLSFANGNTFGRYNVLGPFNSIGQFNGAGQFQNLMGTSTTGMGYDVPSDTPLPGSPIITPGTTWHVQLWYRDNAAGTGQANLSNGVSVNFP
ncbi:MAG: hypothetical protein R3E96_17515, partial [Planctomycetota bacterium]